MRYKEFLKNMELADVDDDWGIVRDIFGEGSIIDYIVESKGSVEYTPIDINNENFILRYARTHNFVQNIKNVGRKLRSIY